MIARSSDLKKLDIYKNNFILLYGKNDGFKKEAISVFLKNKQNVLHYHEKEILDNENEFLDGIFTKSLFEEKKTLVINRVTDKIYKIIKEIIEKENEDIFIILNADILEKKSKLRTLFEKNSKLLCIPFYPDDYQSLYKITHNYFKKIKIAISQSSISLIIRKCNGDRGALLSELGKIENFVKNKKKITQEDISKLTNLIENHEISELVDNCLAKNKSKTLSIINENNFSNEDCILITRIFLNKSKKILKLTSDYQKNRSLDLTISSAKPPIFWKDKDITKKQILEWTPEKIKSVIYKLNNLELVIKKNFYNSVNFIIDFILNQPTETNNKS